MRILTSIFLLSLIAASVHAQTEKDSYMVGGALSFGDGTTTNTPSSPLYSVANPNRNINFSFAPNGSYFLAKNFAVGLLIPAGYSYSGTSSSNNTTTNGIMAGPAVRYYFRKGPWGFFPAASLTLGSQRTVTKFLSGESTSNASLMVWTGGLGAAYFINRNIGIETLLSYRRSESNNDGAGYTVTYSSFVLSVGLQIYLNGKLK